MGEKKFLGARVEQDIYGIVEEVASEEHVDKTTALKLLVEAGWKEMKLEKALTLYRNGSVSIDAAAKIAGITVNNMMQLAVAYGIKSEETIEDYKMGLKLLLSK